MLLQLSSICKTYAGRDGLVHAVQDVSLEVEAGRFVAVQGPSGCGKSTLLLMAGGLLRPDAGEVRVLQQNPYELTPDARARFRNEHVGFVFQQFHLVPYLSVLENVLAPTLALPAADRQRAEALIDRVGLSARRRHRPAELSSGERQRAALARALMNRPRLILADEPTGNLDRRNADLVLGFLAEFSSEGGGVLLVTHDSAAANQADCQIQLRNGRRESDSAIA